MMTDEASLSILAHSSTSISVCVPVISIAGPLAASPKPPKITDPMSRFIASHMMCVRIAPDDPINAPTTVSNGLSSMKPSAHSAQPEYEFSTVITTGMSAPPIDAVMCTPSAPERPVAAPRQSSPVSGDGFVRNNPKAPSDAAPIPMLSWSRPASASGAEPKFPLSLPKATTDPVAVMPPIHVARYRETFVTASMERGPSSTKCTYSPTAVAAAAMPTSEWKAATSCGSSVGPTRFAIM
mmetsp:Transcript_4628/g.14764  ORF Transcript_4628/g.14764 Transcript_4628/m.14764 type:complete len:239 (+) Transcript_4628:516-1232(+)